MISYTQYSVYSQCPMQYDLLYISRKVERRRSDAMDRGARIHKGIEDYLGKVTDDLPPEVHVSWHETLEKLRERSLKLEFKLKTDHAIGIIDCLDGDTVWDWKTGKSRATRLEPREQLKFYAWMLKRDIKGILAWVEHPTRRARLELDIRYTDHLDKVWRRRMDRMLNGPWEENPGWYCAWCPVVQCPHNKMEEK